MLYILIESFGEFIDAVRSHISRLLFFKVTRDIQQTSVSVHRKYAVICLYDTVPRPDLKALLARLSEAGFGIIGVTSNKASAQYSDQLDIIVRVAPIGRDFFAYQQGYRALKKLRLDAQTESLCFLNDSVWYFQPQQQTIINTLQTHLKEENLVAGTMIFDDIPHCSGWLFALPYNQDTRAELEKLFANNFARKSRKFNIRMGEHKILSKLRSVKGVKSLDRPNASPAYSYCYEALCNGLECFYMKGDSTLRTNPSKSKLDDFLQTNCNDNEYLIALQWITQRSDTLLNSKLHLHEMDKYRRRHFK